MADLRDKLGRKIPPEAFDNDHPPTEPVDKGNGSLYDYGKQLIDEAKRDSTRGSETGQRDPGS